MVLTNQLCQKNSSAILNLSDIKYNKTQTKTPTIFFNYKICYIAQHRPFSHNHARICKNVLWNSLIHFLWFLSRNSNLNWIFKNNIFSLWNFENCCRLKLNFWFWISSCNVLSFSILFFSYNSQNFNSNHFLNRLITNKDH